MLLSIDFNDETNLVSDKETNLIEEMSVNKLLNEPKESYKNYNNTFIK